MVPTGGGGIPMVRRLSAFGLLCILAGCTSSPPTPSPAGGGGGGGSVGAGGEPDCGQGGASAQSSGSPASSSSGGSARCSPCNAVLDNHTFDVGGLCPESQA